MNFAKVFLFSLLIWMELVTLMDGKRGRGGGSSRGRGSVSRSKTKSRGSSRTGGLGSSKSKSKSRGGGLGKKFGSAMRNKNIKKGIAAAAAGYITYKLGKKLLGGVGKMMRFGGRPYYYGPQYYRQRSGYQMCSYDLNRDDDQSLSDLWIDDRTRLRQMVFDCRMSEVCCGMECCPRNNFGGGFSWWPILVVLGVVLLICCCACFLVYKFCRTALDCIFPSNSGGSAGDEPKFDAVPMQPPPAQAYPAYPPQPPPQYYPQQPTPYTNYPAQI